MTDRGVGVAPYSASRSRQKPVRGVLLGVHETLFSLSKLRAAFERCALDPGWVSHWYACVLRDGFALAAAGDYQHFVDVAKSRLIALDPHQVGKVEVCTVLDSFQSLEPHADVAGGLQMLRAAGVRVMTLSVGEAAHSELLFAHAGLHHLVDGFLSSDTVRRWKPSLEPYLYGAAQIGWPPGQVALISAHDWDIHGAWRAGLQTGYIARNGMVPASIFRRADVVSDELPVVVESLLQMG